jgi:streptogramin lyase
MLGRAGRITMQGAIDLFRTDRIEVNGFGIIAGPDGNIWITSYGEISSITPDGSQVNVYRCAPNCVPAKITTGPDGRIYYLDQVRHVIGRIS